MDLVDKFNELAKELAQRDLVLSEEDLLILYGLYKQIKNGNCHISQPWKVLKT